MNNIVLSTTRMWNCGDDFIAFGVRNLLESLYPAANYIAYNRNPDLHYQRVFHSSIFVEEAGRKKRADLSNYIRDTTWRCDNSWHERHRLDFVDLCVFAGTPEWFGSMVSPLVHQLSSNETPVLYLGVGGFEGREGLRINYLSADDQEVLRRSQLITVRDRQTADLLESIGALHMPCPALFASQTSRVRSPGRLRIALSTQPETSLQPPSSEGVYEFTEALFRELAQSHSCEVVCHYVDELEPLSKLGLPVRYSYDARDYLQIYDEFDLVVTTRVHGAGIAASLGVPSLVIKHSARTSTANGFLSSYIDPLSDSVQSVIAQVEALDVQALSQELVAHKARAKDAYLQLLTSRLAVPAAAGV